MADGKECWSEHLLANILLQQHQRLECLRSLLQLQHALRLLFNKSEDIHSRVVLATLGKVVGYAAAGANAIVEGTVLGV